MSNLQLSASSDITESKKRYLDLICNGYSETKALEESQLPKHLYIKLLLEDMDFISEVESARKVRADFWVSKISESIDDEIEKDQVPSARLTFDKLQYLAKADNPERYGNNSKKVDINIDLKQFKLLPPEEALKSLAMDPFAIEVDYTEVPEDGELL
jgi:hypothetical protein